MTAPDYAPPRLASEPRRRSAAISLTPLIDVVFILLVFFMLASSFLQWRAIELETPAQAGPSAGMTGALLVEVRASNLRLGGQRLGRAALAERVRARLETKPEQRVIVKPAAGVPMQRTVDIVDRLTGVGVRNLSLMRGRAP